jgi:hypothetical protein
MKRACLALAALLLAACANIQPSSLSTTQSPTASTTTAGGEVLDTLPITLTSADQNFFVDAGEYSVEWSVAGGDTDCHFAITASPVAPVGGQEDVAIINTNVVGQEPVNGTTDFAAAVAGEYELHHANYPEDPCNRQWSATIKEK